jgi:hypothetical protein
VQLLLDVIPMLGNVFLVTCLFVIFFGVSAVQLWKGAFRYGCYDSDDVLYVPHDRDGYVCGQNDIDARA